ncbi:hypothetical protein IAR55_000744 [Kwoniella newhampshirensis]|uniref:Exostosin GT47 domain-containing protein n=1 Tax=Kwoniella newhampshirensis TaxID=1651941 RepID=A0AAW0Z3Q1_9TREE
MRLTAPPRTSSLTSLLVLPVPLAALILAYLWSVSKRPDIPEYAQVEDPHQWGFPKWYGKGASPYDYGVEPDGKEQEKCDDPKNVLLFIDLPYDSSDMPHVMMTVTALESDPTINVTTISLFSKKWDPERNEVDNLVEAGCETMDWIWRIGANSGDLGETKRCGGAIWVQEGARAKADVTLLDQPHDMLEPLTKQADESGTGVGLLSHILPAVIFYPERQVPSLKSITYFPRASTLPRDYPSLPWGRTWTVHPPSRKIPPKVKPDQDPFSPRSAYRRHWEKEDKRKASALRQAGICLFEGWQDGVVDEQVAQAMLSGCVVAMVSPHAEHDMFAPLILPIPKPSLSNASTPTPLPVESLDAYLSETTSSELKHKALHAFIIARRHLDPRARTKAVSSTVNKWENGGRGYDFPHGYRWDCDSIVKPAWCR